jgi:Flp pilus assembly protein TadD
LPEALAGVRPRPAEARERLDSLRALALPALVLVALTVAAFAPVVKAGYVWDDDLYVTGNPHLQDAAGLFDMWFRLGSTTMYAPAVFTTLWVEHQLWGLDPLGYHLVNLAFHLACVLLLWAFLRRLGVRGAWLAAALFGVHPVMVESVAWVVELKNVQSAFFGLLALLAYLRFDPLDGTPRPAAGTRRLAYALALLFYAASLLSKPVVVTLPPALLILVWWKRGRIGKDDVLPLAPLLALGLAAAFLALHVEHHYGGAVGAAWQLSWLERVLVAGRAVWFYAATLAWPANLLSVYPRWEISTRAWWQYLYPLGAAAVVGALWLGRGRLGRGPLAAVLCFGVLVSPLVGIFNVAYHLYSFVADHFQYHAAPALFALFASGASRLRAVHGRVLGHAVEVGCGVLLLVYAALTFRHVGTFRDEKTRCQRTIEGNPESWSATYNLGLELKKEGDARGALRWYARTLELTPGNPEVYNNVGVALMSLGDAEGAVRSYREALRLAPTYALAHHNLAGALGALGDRQSAVREYEEALRLEPGLAAARRDLAKVLAADGRGDDAERELREALRAKPDDADARHNLGVALDRAGRADEAIRELREALRLDPASATIQRDLASALAHAGMLDEAIRLYQEALRRSPSDAEAHNGLGLARAWAGQTDEAAREFRASLKLDPEYADAYVNFGTLLLSQARLPEAIDHYERAIRLRPDSAKAHAGLGAALASAGRLDAAVAAFREAVRLEPGSAENHELLGEGLAQAGRFDEAVVVLERALEIDPGSASARRSLEEARGARGGGGARRKRG